MTRDKLGTSDPRVPEALADAELQFGDTIPTGTYLDMTANLPLVDSTKVEVPVLLVRGEHDGIAIEGDLFNFFALSGIRTRDGPRPHPSSALARGARVSRLARMPRRQGMSQGPA